MKYFIHLVESGDDPDIGAAMELYGSPAYFAFFRTLEIMAREFDIDNPGKNTFAFSWFFRRFYGKISKAKLLMILEYYHKRRRIYSSIKEGEIYLNCPKLRELSDEYTKKMLRIRDRKTPDNVRTKSGETPEPLYIDKDKDKDNKILRVLAKPKNGFCTLCLTLLLMDGIKTFDEGARLPEFGTPTFIKWLDEIRKMRELDKRSRPFIYDLIIFSQESEFWRSNILSTHKLRDKSTALLHQSKKYYEAKRERRVGEHKRR